MQSLKEIFTPNQLTTAFSKEKICLSEYGLKTSPHENPRFVVVKGNWKEKSYSFTIDRDYGDIYNDFGKAHLYFNNAALVIATPFLIVIDECLQVYRFTKLINPENTTLKVHHFALDFLRLPAYRTAILAVHISALFIGAVKPRLLYDIRAFQAKLYRAMFRLHDQNEIEWPFCQMNLSNITVVGCQYRKDPDTDDPQLGLNSLAERIFRHHSN